MCFCFFKQKTAYELRISDWSSDVCSSELPFTTAVAEQFVQKNPKFKPPIVESTGTGGGFKLFCGGVGAQHPDVSNASRRIKVSEVAQCSANGVTNIIELKVGVDGLAVATGKATQFPGLTTADIYKALRTGGNTS